jgi:Na+-transporting NADH:ubiquinone oxidoreductase subunit C
VRNVLERIDEPHACWWRYAVSLVSSVFVAGAAVSLKPVQIENRQLDKQRSMLAIAGLHDRALSAREVKERSSPAASRPRVVDLDTGAYDRFPMRPDNVFDPLKEGVRPEAIRRSRGEETSPASSGASASPRWSTRSSKDGKLDALILPVRGYGLWSTLHGFLAVDGDLNTVVGLALPARRDAGSGRRSRQPELEGSVARQAPVRYRRQAGDAHRQGQRR